MKQSCLYSGALLQGNAVFKNKLGIADTYLSV